MAGITELEKAALMFAVAADSILNITGVEEIRTKYVTDSDGKRKSEFYVHITDEETFDQLAEGREIEIVERDSADFPTGHSFMLHGIRFLTLRREV